MNAKLGFCVLINALVCVSSITLINYPLRRTQKIVPIKPMNLSKWRSTHRLPPLNPDAEFISQPTNTHRIQPEKIMERLRADGESETTKNSQFDYMNFDAYLPKPMKFNYNKVWATLQPETERVLESLNQTERYDHDEEPTQSHYVLRKRKFLQLQRRF